MDRTTTAIAEFAASLRLDDLTPRVFEATRNRLIDALGCGMGGFDSEPGAIARRLAATATSTPAARVLGTAVRTTPELATFANSAVIRYLDANDQYQGERGSGHPSDVLGALLAAATMTGSTAGDLLVALNIGYEVFGALAEVIPLRDRGWDQGVVVAPAVAAATGRLLGLNAGQIGEAISIAQTAYVATRQTRSGVLSMWKGAATAAAAQGGLFAARLAREGMTGPTAAYEGGDGLWQTVSGEFTLPPLGGTAGPWAVERSNYKYLPAEFHAQGPVTVILKMRAQAPADQVAAINVQIYSMAYGEIGSGAMKWDPQTRETADHSLPYMLAAALTDGDLGPASFTQARITDPALRPLMAKITVTENPEFTAGYPHMLMSEVEVVTTGGQRLVERTPYPKGHNRNPMSDADVDTKFRSLSRGHLGAAGAGRALAALRNLQPTDSVDALLDLFVP